MEIIIHQTNHTIADFENIFDYLINIKTKEGELHLLPELYLTGYPLQDLCLQKYFIDDYQTLLLDINAWSKSQKIGSGTFLMGGLHYDLDANGLPICIENVVYELNKGQELKAIYTKQLLPNYDLYEEKKYFSAGNKPKIYSHHGQMLGILICEDMWFSHLNEMQEDPVMQLAEVGVDAVINFSASPWHLGKLNQRIKRCQEVATLLGSPVIYVNRVGAEDDILFDGQSMVVGPEGLIEKASRFTFDQLKISLFSKSYTKSGHESCPPSWDYLYSTRLSADTKELQSLKDSECEEILEAICFGIDQYAKKIHCKKFLVALSGGMDSALVLTILSLLKGYEIEAIYMPGLYSATESFDLSSDLALNLKIPLKNLPIKFLHSNIRLLFKDHYLGELKSLADENAQSRLRGLLLFARANQENSLVLNTSNKSEIAVGYSTLYGDSVGALSPLGDLFKTEVYSLARYINKKYKNLIPPGIIDRAPSAELRENQKDEDSLPPYEQLDPILEALISGRFSTRDLVKKGHQLKFVEQTFKLFSMSEYKRRQFCPILKMKGKSFGAGYRMPISKKIHY